jgi:hypothetical protein
LKHTDWAEIDVDIWSNEYDTYGKTIQKIEKRSKELEAFSGIDNLFKLVFNTLPIMDQLQINKLREGL